MAIVAFVVGTTILPKLIGNNTPSTTPSTTISDIRQHPAQYVGKQVELKGFVSFTGYDGYGYYELSNMTTPIPTYSVYLINLPNNFSPSNVMYDVKGIVMLSYNYTMYNTPGVPNSGVGGWMELGLTINVTNIRLAD